MKFQNIKLIKIAKDLKKKYPLEVSDIIIFGSLMRGKEKPTDIDVVVVFFNNVNKDIEYLFKKQAEKLISNISLISKTNDSIQDDSFDARDGIFFEGFSLIRECFLSSEKGYTSFGMFTYQTKKLKNTDRTKFSYALHGRNGSNGVLSSLLGFRLSDNVLLFPLENISRAEDFFSYWKIDYKFIPVLIPTRMAKESIIKNV
jgi:predicted nucleotidyltransferase